MSELATIKVDAASGVPPYEQIRRGFSQLIAKGALEPGTRLPTVRQLAGYLGLAVNTVARAYRELDEAGVVVTRRRAGTHVAYGVSLQHASSAQDRTRQLDEAARAYVTTARRLGADDATAAAAVSKVIRVTAS